MADVKISNLPASTTPLAGTEVLPIVQSGVTKQVSVNDLTTGKAVTALSVTATDLTASSAVATDGTKKLVSVTNTGSGNNVLATAPTVANPTVTNYTESVVAIGTVGASYTFDLTNGTVQTATLTASTATTFTMPTATAGKSFVLLLKQAAVTGNGTATFTNVKWNSQGAPIITATAGKMDIVSFFADGTNWYGSVNQGFTP